jgi:hypothetical protein
VPVTVLRHPFGAQIGEAPVGDTSRSLPLTLYRQGLLVIRNRTEIPHIKPVFKEVKLTGAPNGFGTQRATMLVYFERVSVLDQRIDMQPCTVAVSW